MTRTVRLSAALLLAGLVQLFLPNDASSQNTPWEFEGSVDPLTDEQGGVAVSLHVDGGLIGFACSKGDAKGQPIAQFTAVASTQESDRYPDGDIEVAWRTDSDAIHNEFWEANTVSNAGAVKVSGPAAVAFARAVMKAQNRIVFRNPKGTVVFDSTGSTKAIARLFGRCGIDG